MPVTRLRRSNQRKNIRRRGFRVYFYKDEAAVRRAFLSGFSPDKVKITDVRGATMTQAVMTSIEGYLHEEQVVITRLLETDGRRFGRPWLWVMAFKNQESKENNVELKATATDAAMMRAFFSSAPPRIPLLL